MSDYMITQTEQPVPTPVASPVPPQPKEPQPLLIPLTALCVAAVALVLSLCALVRTLPPPADKPLASPGVVLADPDTIITYKDRQLPVFTQVGINQYDNTCFSAADGRVTYTQNGRQALTGIDVSFYQEDIDWKQVKAAGIDFAIIRVGFRGYGPSGLISEDSCFRQNIVGALDAGLQVGVYFFSQAITVWEAQEEANFVLNAIKDYEVTFPVVFDWERITNATARTDGLPGGTLTLCANAFCDTVAQAGYTPVIYFNQDLGYLGYDLDRLKDYDFWLAEYRASPTFFYHFDLWQYSAKGQVPGIKGNVDLNLCFTDYSKQP